MTDQRKRIAQHVFEKEILQLRNKGEALQGDYNRLRNTVAAIARKHKAPIHLTREDLEATMREMSEENGRAKMLVTQHPDGDGLILTYAPDGEHPAEAIVRAAKISWWRRTWAWLTFRFHAATR